MVDHYAAQGGDFAELVGENSGAAAVLVHTMGRPQAAQGVVFLDRDGVIVENRPDYVKSWEEVNFIPGAFEALRRLNIANYALVVITNQSAIGRGIIRLEDAIDINRHILDEVEAHGARIDASYLCPHVPDYGCDCRKPSPGMILRAARDLALDLNRSYVVGDNITDLEAARAVGVRAILVRTGLGMRHASLLESEGVVGCQVVEDLSAAVDRILDQAKKVPEGNTRHDYLSNAPAHQLRRRRERPVRFFQARARSRRQHRHQ